MFGKDCKNFEAKSLTCIFSSILYNSVFTQKSIKILHIEKRNMCPLFTFSNQQGVFLFWHV